MTAVGPDPLALLGQLEEAREKATNPRNSGDPYAIMSEAARCANTSRPLTHLLDLGERGLAVKATHEPTPIPECPGYGATADGRIWSLTSNWRGYGVRPLTPVLDRDGYHRVRFMANGKRAKRTVHTLVLSALVGPRPSPAHQVRHLNGDRTDNRVENLAWGTAAENADDRDQHGTTARGSRNGSSRLTEESVAAIRRRYSTGESQYLLADDYGVSQSMVSQIVRGKWWKA